MQQSLLGEKVQGLRKLEHEVPRLRRATLTGMSPVFRIRNGHAFYDLASAPTWASESAPSLKEKSCSAKRELVR